MSGRRVLFAAALLCAVGARAQTPPPPQPAPPPRAQPAPPPQGQPPPAPAPKDGDPDEGLLEFLGSDDVGDAAWWEFLKRSHPKGSNTATPPDGKQ